MRHGERRGRIVTVEPADIDPDGPALTPATLAKGERVYVHRRTDCLRRGADVERFEIDGRRADACRRQRLGV